MYMDSGEEARLKDSLAHNPLVSIITPALNGVRFLEACIQSVLNQSYPHIEHIFSDGGSTDGTLEMLAGYQAKYPERIKFISEPDEGVGEAWNKGFRIAKGEIFGWLDTDDIYEPDAIMTVVEFFRTNPGAYFVYGDRNMINEKGEIIGKFLAKDFDLKEAIRDKYYITFCSAFYRREVIEKVGAFNTLGNDLDFWIRIGKVFPMHRIEKILSSWRLHEDSISGSKEADKARIRKARLREDYHLGRQHGAGIFSPRARRYYRFLVLDSLGLYPLIHKLYPVVRKVLRRE
ncbi:glycosyltransferase family 2 protein [Chloroflexota bacterium]